MIGISSPTFDINGSFVFHKLAEGSDVDSIARRVTRTATLDGGAYIYDGGFSDGDRTLIINLEGVERDVADGLALLVKNYPLLNFSLPGGVYEGAVEKYSAEGGVVKMRVLIKQKISG